MFKTACSRPPTLLNGNYSSLVNNYTEGDVVNFTCEAQTLASPTSGQIVCGKDDWNENATCIKRKLYFEYLFIFI